MEKINKNQNKNNGVASFPRRVNWNELNSPSCGLCGAHAACVQKHTSSARGYASHPPEHYRSQFTQVPSASLTSGSKVKRVLPKKSSYVAVEAKPKFVYVPTPKQGPYVPRKVSVLGVFSKVFD